MCVTHYDTFSFAAKMSWARLSPLTPCSKVFSRRSPSKAAEISFRFRRRRENCDGSGGTTVQKMLIMFSFSSVSIRIPGMKLLRRGNFACSHAHIFCTARCMLSGLFRLERTPTLPYLSLTSSAFDHLLPSFDVFTGKTCNKIHPPCRRSA